MKKPERIHLLFNNGAKLLQAAMDNDLAGIERHSSPETVNACVGDRDGRYALHWATHHKNPDAIERLVADGADPFLTDDNDMDSFALASEDPALRNHIIACMQQREEKKLSAPVYEPC